MMTSDELNAAITDLDEEHSEAVPYWGWWWRAVDFDAESCSLAASSSEPPEWWDISAEYLVEIPWGGRRTAFCENNKWGYPEFEVSGEEWKKLRALVEAVATGVTEETVRVLAEYLVQITPAESDMEPGL